ncbi:MAG: hypothetical protein RIQ70_1050 [Bacteroidota bacterium]|jgi:hypothetical protein
MKNILLILFAITYFNVNATFAQSAEDKKLKKEWAKKVKAMDPLEIKNLMEQNDDLVAQKSVLTSKVSNLESKLKIKEELNRSLTTELDSLKSSQNNSTAAVVSTPTVATTTPTVTPPKANIAPVTTGGKQYKADKLNYNGVVFKVQVGAFKNKDLSKYLDNNKNFSGDTDADGQRKYTLGLFTDYWEADNFKKLLREMGVSDAWVVAYKAGQRVSIKDVLEGSTAE